jgi:hypothetical protein
VGITHSKWWQGQSKSCQSPTRQQQNWCILHIHNMFLSSMHMPVQCFDARYKLDVIFPHLHPSKSIQELSEYVQILQGQPCQCVSQEHRALCCSKSLWCVSPRKNLHGHSRHPKGLWKTILHCELYSFVVYMFPQAHGFVLVLCFTTMHWPWLSNRPAIWECCRCPLATTWKLQVWSASSHRGQSLLVGVWKT